jgi:preprotein translocase subunit YajC
MTPATDSFLLIAQAASGAGQSGSSFDPRIILVYGLLIVGMWFLFIAPQRKREKDHIKLVSELEAGDEIVTSGGLFGEITNKKDDRFVVRIADGVKVEIGKSFVQSIVRKAGSSKS